MATSTGRSPGVKAALYERHGAAAEGRRGRQPGAPRAAGLDLAGRGRAAVGNGGRVDRDPGAAGGTAARGRLTRAWREPRRASDDRVLVPLRRWAADRADGAYRWGRR